MCKELSQLKFGEVHCHSAYSDGISSVEQNIRRAKALGMDALGLTDHGTMGGIVEHWKICNEQGITPILGSEGYIRLPEALQVDSRNSASGRYHITLFSSGLTGYTNLVNLNNASHENRERSRNRYFPIITFDMLRNMDLEGIIVGTGCPASVTYHDNYDVANEYVRFLVQCFGEENVYAELMEHEISREKDGSTFNCWDRPMELAKLYNLQTVWSGDVHAATPEDLGHLKILQKATAFEYTVNTLKGKEETYKIAARLVGHDEALTAMQGVDKLINAVEEVDLEVPFELPDVGDLVEYIQEKLRKAFALDLEAYKDELGEDSIRQRFQNCWDLTEKFSEFWKYYAIVNDLVEYAHQNNISVTARGSGGGSYFLYLLGVTQLNPIKHGLYEERFLCEKRLDKGELPDVDLDFASNKRDKIQKYAFERWNMLGVCTYLTYSHKSLIRFLGRTWGHLHGYNMNPDVISRATRYEAYEYDSDGFVIGKTESFETFCKYAPWIEPMYNSMLDTISGTGTHACALAVVDGTIAVPVEGFTDSLTIAYVESGSNKSLQLVGRVKIDGLGLNAEGLLDEMQEMIDETIPTEIMDGDPCFTLYNQGATGGLFQFDTGVSRSIVEKNRGHINSIHDLSRMTAKGRPGAMSQGLHLITPDNPADISHHPDFIQDILRPTYGVCCYQEQVMSIYASVAYSELNKDSLEEGVVALKSLVPKHFSIAEQDWWKAQYADLHDKFMQGGKELHQLDEDYLEEFFDSLKGFTRYGFNLPHSLLYANLSARMAWVKFNYPEVFWTITLRNTPNNKEHLDETIRYFVEATRFGGVTITAPTINTAGDVYTLNTELKQVQMPLTAIKGIGPSVSDGIFNERTENGPFKSLEDFASRCKLSVPKRKLFYECGIFDDIKTGDVNKDLLALGVRESKEFKVRGKKWEADDVIEITIVSTEPYVEFVGNGEVILIIDELGDSWKIGEYTKTALRGDLLPGLVLKIIHNGERIIEFKKTKYVEEAPTLLDREKAIREAYGFTWSDKWVQFYEGMEEDTVGRFFGFVCDVEEDRKTPKTTQLSITLESGRRVWFLKEDNSNLVRVGPYKGLRWLTSEGMKQCAALSEERGQHIPFITPDAIPDIKIGDVVGGLCFTGDDENGNKMTYGQVMKCTVY